MMRPDCGDSPPVSVIVPARDAHAALPGALESILGQDHDGPIDVVVADGSRKDRTRDLLRERYPQVRRVANPEATIPSGLNLALAHCRHAIVARCDVRATLPPDYLSRAVATLDRTGAVNVGGRPVPVGDSGFERAVALAMSSPLGAGDSRYRVDGAEGPVDTVYLGVYRRTAIEDIGGWNEALWANEDYELNWRLRQRGFVVWFDPALRVRYRPKANIRALAAQYFGYGRWKAMMLARHPRSVRPRQLAAPLLVAGLSVSTGLLLSLGLESATRALAAAAPVLAYAAALLACSGATARGRAPALLVAAVAATIHLAWGTGFYCALPLALGRLFSGRKTPTATPHAGKRS